MGYKIILTEGGRSSYDHTVDYYLNVLENPALAIKWMNEVHKTLAILQANPEAQPICEDEFLSQNKIRKVRLRKYKYKIFYHLENGDEIHVDMILHDKQDVEKWLG